MTRKQTPTTFDGAQLQALREAAGLTPKELARQVPHLRGDVVELYENGQRFPTFGRLKDIATALNADTTSLLNPDLATSPHHWHREAAGLSHADVANELDIHKVTVARWDTGHVGSQYLTKCAQLYGTTPDILASPRERSTVTYTPATAAEIDRRRGKQTRDRYLSDLITRTHTTQQE